MPETEFKGTPGPWKYDGGNSITAEFGDVGICILEPIEKFWCGDVNRYPEGEEYEANARLIAASPRMLESLERLYKIFAPIHHDPKGLTVGGDALLAALAVIKEAKGE